MAHRISKSFPGVSGLSLGQFKQLAEHEHAQNPATFVPVAIPGPGPNFLDTVHDQQKSFWYGEVAGEIRDMIYTALIEGLHLEVGHGTWQAPSISNTRKLNSREIGECTVGCNGFLTRYPAEPRASPLKHGLAFARTCKRGYFDTMYRFYSTVQIKVRSIEALYSLPPQLTSKRQSLVSIRTLTYHIALAHQVCYGDCAKCATTINDQVGVLSRMTGLSLLRIVVVAPIGLRRCSDGSDRRLCEKWLPAQFNWLSALLSLKGPERIIIEVPFAESWMHQVILVQGPIISGTNLPEIKYAAEVCPLEGCPFLLCEKHHDCVHT